MADTIYFSVSAQAFYTQNTYSGTMPDDVKEITADQRTTLLGYLNSQKVVSYDATNGYTAADKTVSTADQWTAYQLSAQKALAASDTTMLRISEAVCEGSTTWTTADVVAFVAWRKELRAILSETQPDTIPTALPTQPDYPAGTD